MTMNNETALSGFGAGAPYRPEAHPARVYDYFIGGENGLEPDRAAGAWIQMRAPDLLAAMQANRAFLVRVVQWLTQQGVDQFIDIGSGFPVSPNTHEIAFSALPSASVVYCDLDPVVGERTRALIADHQRTAFVQGDIRAPGELLTQPAIQDLVRSGRPVACMLAAVLHFLPEDADPAGIAAILREALPEGSYLVVSHVASDIPWGDGNDEETLTRALDGMYPRSRDQVTAFFRGLDLVEPGVVPASSWRPTERSTGRNSSLAIYAGVARKP